MGKRAIPRVQVRDSPAWIAGPRVAFDTGTALNQAHGMKPISDRSDLSRRAVLGGGLAAGTLIAAPRALAAVAAARTVSLLDFIPASERAAIAAGRSNFDCAPAMSSAMAAGAGAVLVPAGRYVMASRVRFVPRVVARFAPGPTIIGDGPDLTVFENRLTSGALFDFDSGATRSDFAAISNLQLSGFSVEGRATSGNASAIRMRSCFMTELSDLRVIGQRGDGIVIDCLLGDNDGSNMVRLERVRIENCAGWGLRAAAAPGANEISFLHMRHVAIQNCGTPGSVIAPTSGGMRYKGQILTMEQCGFTINQNAALYIPGEAGLCINANIASTAFENNMGRQILCTGVSVFSARNIQFFNNDAYRAEVACEFRGDKFTVREVDIDGVTIRATPGNRPYTSFRFTGANLERASCNVRNVIWEHFGFPGQEKAAGLVVG